jgi:hypothetical protein
MQNQYDVVIKSRLDALHHTQDELQKQVMAIANQIYILEQIQHDMNPNTDHKEPTPDVNGSVSEETQGQKNPDGTAPETSEGSGADLIL